MFISLYFETVTDFIFLKHGFDNKKIYIDYKYKKNQDTTETGIVYQI